MFIILTSSCARFLPTRRGYSRVSLGNDSGRRGRRNEDEDRLIDNLEPANRPRAIAFIAAFPDFWQRLQEPTRTALQATIDNADPAELADYRILAGVTLPQFRTAVCALIAGLNRNQVANAIASQPLTDLWPRAVEEYQGSGICSGFL